MRFAVRCVEIANRELSAICHAVGVLKVRDSNQLHYKRMLVSVVVEKRDGYQPQNVVKGYKPLEGAGAAATTVETAPAVKKPSWAG